MMYCENCGTKLSDNAKFCPTCGKTIKPIGNSETNPNQEQKGYKRAASASKESLALGILFCISGIFAIILLAVDLTNDETKAIASVVSVFAVAELVLIIILLTRWSSVKRFTNHSHLWITVAYPCAFAVALILLALSTLLNKTNEGAIVYLTFDILIDAFIIFVSFFNFSRIKKTLHN